MQAVLLTAGGRGLFTNGVNIPATRALPGGLIVADKDEMRGLNSGALNSLANGFEDHWKCGRANAGNF